MDRAIWVTWYDLPAADRRPYFTWLHETYIPRVLAQPRVLWAAHYQSESHYLPPGRVRQVNEGEVAAGNAYILLFGAEDVHAFADPVPSKLHAAFPQAERRMLGMRTGERVNLFTEEARVDGPEAAHREGPWALSPCIQIGSFNAAAHEDEEGILDWYAHNRMAAMRHLPGCLGVRKYVSAMGWAKHGIIYEFVSRRARDEHFQNHINANREMKEWSDRIVPTLIHAPGSPNVAVRIWPPVKNPPG